MRIKNEDFFKSSGVKKSGPKIPPIQKAQVFVAAHFRSNGFRAKDSNGFYHLCEIKKGRSFSCGASFFIRIFLNYSSSNSSHSPFSSNNFRTSGGSSCISFLYQKPWCFLHSSHGILPVMLTRLIGYSLGWKMTKKKCQTKMARVARIASK